MSQQSGRKYFPLNTEYRFWTPFTPIAKIITKKNYLHW